MRRELVPGNRLNGQIVEFVAIPRILNRAGIKEFAECEACIEQNQAASLVIARCWLSIRDNCLYDDNYWTFESYVKLRWPGISTKRANQLASFAEIRRQLLNAGFDMLPERESQVRPLERLDRDVRQKVWEESVERAGGKFPSGALVAQIARQYKARSETASAQANMSGRATSAVNIAHPEIVAAAPPPSVFYPRYSWTTAYPRVVCLCPGCDSTQNPSWMTLRELIGFAEGTARM